jgi:predicted transcriptional regulator
MSEKRKQGELEAEVLGCLWDKPKGLSSQAIVSALGKDVKLTTVLTVLSRLEDKGLVSKSAGAGRSYTFFATSTREEYTAKQLLSLLDSSNQSGVFSHFAAGLSSKQVAQLRKVLDK